MNYRHSDHAANLSDLVKHLCLSSLRHTEGLATLWDAFAAAPATAMSRIAHRRPLLERVMKSSGPAALTALQEIIRDCRMEDGQAAYPGSATILAGYDAVRKLILTDRDRECIDRQQARFATSRQPLVEACVLDSYRQAERILVRRPDLVFIDPPCVEAWEWRAIDDLLQTILGSDGSTRIVCWYPRREGQSSPLWPGTRLRVDYAGNGGLAGCAMQMLNFDPACLAELMDVAEWMDGGGLPGIASVQLDQPV